MDLRSEFFLMKDTIWLWTFCSYDFINADSFSYCSYDILSYLLFAYYL